MTVTRTEHLKVNQDEIDYPANRTFNAPYPPRCSLDLRIRLPHGEITDKQLRLESFQGHEAISGLFEYHLVLRANDDLFTPPASDSKPLVFDQVLGADACIMLGTPETDNDVNLSAYPNQRPVVYFNGIITSFAMAHRGVYHATLKPALFKLSLQNNYRVFSQETILKVVCQVLEENNIKFNQDELYASHSEIVTGLANYRVQDWLQAGESDLDFIHRLMQKVNLFYYFVHDEFSQTMVITDQPYYKTIYQREVNKAGFNVETSKIKSLVLSYTQQDSLDYDNKITEFKYEQNMISSGITAILAEPQAVWESQNTAQVSPVFVEADHQTEKLNMQQVHKVQYGATQEEAYKKAQTSLKKLEASRFTFSGSSTCADLKAGHTFLVLQAPEEITNGMPIRPELDEKEFVVTSVQHQATATGDYKNSFTAVSAEGLATPSPAHDAGQGSIWARVVKKPSGTSKNTNSQPSELVDAEIDHQGSSAKQLERNVFNFDSKTFKYDHKTRDEQVSCKGIYVRFMDRLDSTPPVWVKLADHMQTIPEIGAYVVISRSQDETEIPEVQQILQNKGSKVIMPQGYTTNTNVGDSYNTSYGDSTSIGMGADVTTSLETAQDIVMPERESGNYNDVRYSESSAYSYSVTPHSHNFSVTGSGSGPSPNPSDKMQYVQYSHSITRGDSFNNNETYGNAVSESTTVGNVDHTGTTTGNSTSHNTTTGNNTSTSITTGNNTSTNTQNGNVTNTNTNHGSISNNSVHQGFNNNVSTHSGMANTASNMNGMQNSATNTNGNINSATNTNGVVNNVNVFTGMENSASTKNGVFLSAENVNGIRKSTSLVTGSSFEYSNIVGSHDKKTIVGGVWIEQRDAIAKQENDNFAAWAKNKVVAALTGTETAASDSGIKTTASNSRVETTQTDNSISSKTTNNTVANIGAGTQTTNNAAVQTELNGANQTSIVVMVVVL